MANFQPGRPGIGYVQKGAVGTPSEARSGTNVADSTPRRQPWARNVRALQEAVRVCARFRKEVLTLIEIAATKSDEFAALRADHMANIHEGTAGFLQDRASFEMQQAVENVPEDYQPYPYAAPNYDDDARRVLAYEAASQIAWSDLRRAIDHRIFKELIRTWNRVVVIDVDPSTTSLAEYQELQATADKAGPILIKANLLMADVDGAVAEEKRRLKRLQDDEPEALADWIALKETYRNITPTGSEVLLDGETVDIADLKLEEAVA